jgi:hypothetical protein
MSDRASEALAKPVYRENLEQLYQNIVKFLPLLIIIVHLDDVRKNRIPKANNISTLEILQFCFENKIILCRLFSYTVPLISFSPMTSESLSLQRQVAILN